MWFVALTSPAAAAPSVALDFAAPPDCPDAGRFSDEVSARVGRQSFRADGDPLVVRIATGAEYVGTAEWAGGTRVVRGAACGEVFEGLVAAVSVVLDAPPPPARIEPAADQVTVQFVTNRPRLTVARVEGHGTVLSSTSDGDLVALASDYTRDLCVAPCSVTMAPGIAEFVGYGRRYRSVDARFDLQGEPTIELRPEPRWPQAIGGVLVLGALVGGSLVGCDAAVDAASEGEDSLLPGRTQLALGLLSLVGFGGSLTLDFATAGSIRLDPADTSGSSRL